MARPMCARISDSASWPSRDLERAQDLPVLLVGLACAAPARRPTACDRCEAGDRGRRTAIRRCARCRTHARCFRGSRTPSALAQTCRAATAERARYASSSCADPVELLGGHALGREVARHAFERHAHLEELPHEVRRELDDAGALVRLAGDELVALQPPDRLAHGSAARRGIRRRAPPRSGARPPRAGRRRFARAGCGTSPRQEAPRSRLQAPRVGRATWSRLCPSAPKVSTLRWTPRLPRLATWFNTRLRRGQTPHSVNS